MDTILSIVIPTRNRYSTLIPVVEGIQTWDSDEFEIVIQDNSDDNSLIEQSIINWSKDPRISYYYEINRLSAPENCDLGIKNARGEYICFIGDDDGLSQESLNLTKWMRKENIDSAHTVFSSYAWPDLKVKHYGFALSGYLNIPKFDYSIKLVSPFEELNSLLSNGALQITSLPRVYHGFVRKNCLEKLFDKTGTYFPGPVPDMSNAVGLVVCVERHIEISYPFIICGSSGHSMAGKGAQKQHHGEIKNEKSLPVDAEKNWSNVLPKYWSAQTIWAEGALKALDNMGLFEYKNKLNLEANLSACLMYVPKYRKITLKKIKELHEIKKIKITNIVYYFTILAFTRIKSLLTYSLSILLKKRIDMYYNEPCSSGKEAIIKLKEFTDSHPIKYNLDK